MTESTQSNEDKPVMDCNRTKPGCEGFCVGHELVRNDAQQKEPLTTTYAFVADNMFIESDLFFQFVIREAVRHQRDLSKVEMAGLLKQEAERLIRNQHET